MGGPLQTGQVSSKSVGWLVPPLPGPFVDALLIYFEFRSKPSLITVICMDPHSPNKLFATKYCFLILRDDTSFFFFLSLFFVFFFCYFTLLLTFTKNLLLLLLLLFHENYFYFFPGCSGIFRNVLACSGMFPVPGYIDARRPRLSRCKKYELP